MKKFRTTIAFLLTAMLAAGAATIAFASEDIPPASERETEVTPPSVVAQDGTLIPETPPQEGGLLTSEQDGTRRIYFFSSEGDPISEEREFAAAEETPVVQETPSLTLADYQALNDAMGEDSSRGTLTPALGAQDDSIRVNEFDDIQDTDMFDLPVMALPETPVPIAADTAADTTTTAADDAADRTAIANSPALDGTEGSNNPDTGAGTTTDDDLNPDIVNGTTSNDNVNPNLVTGDLANPETGAATALPLLLTALAAFGSVPVLLRKREK